MTSSNKILKLYSNKSTLSYLLKLVAHIQILKGFIGLKSSRAKKNVQQYIHWSIGHKKPFNFGLVWQPLNVQCASFCIAEINSVHSLVYTVVQFTKFLSGQFTIAFVVNPPDKKLVKSTTVQCTTARALQLLPVYRFYNRHWRTKGNRAQWTRLETKKGPEITMHS